MKPIYTFLCLFLLSGVAVADISGSARVIDGDTVKIGKTRIQLYGIDALEKRQKCDKAGYRWRCGKKATKTLWSYTKGKSVLCKGSKTDRYKRLIAICYVEGKDLNAAMVDAGLALASRKSSTQYVANELKAKGVKKGVWSGTFIKPWDWRKGKRLKPSKVSTCCKRCKKKNNDKKNRKDKKDKSCKSACSKKSSVCEKP